MPKAHFRRSQSCCQVECAKKPSTWPQQSSSSCRRYASIPTMRVWQHSSKPSASAAPFADRVILGFEYGVLMDDAAGLLEGDGKQVRYVTLRRQTDLRPGELSALIAEAAMVAATRARGG
jgi:hypothetical protein